MREIKFRAWTTDDEKMLSWYDIEGSDEAGSVMFLDMLKDELNYKVMQFTGLQDRNGKDIYEGDILEHITYVRPQEHHKGIVCYDLNKATYKLVPPSAYNLNAGNGGWTGFFFDSVIAAKSEVKGNIYEHPHQIHNECGGGEIEWIKERISELKKENEKMKGTKE